MRDEWLEGDDGAIAYLDGQPVDSGVDDAVLVERGEAVENAATERELRVKVDDKPIVCLEAAGSLRGYI